MNTTLKMINQESIEDKYSRRNRRKILHNVFKELTDKPLELDILGLLAAQGTLYLDTCISILLERSDDIDQQEQNYYELTETILHMIETDLIDGLQTDGTIKLISKYVLNQEVLEQLKLLQTLPPMIVQPIKHKYDPLHKNKGSGYLKDNSSLVLGNPLHNHHNRDICTDALNKANSVPMSINLLVLNHGRNSWESIDKPKPNETKEAYTKRRDAFDLYQRTSYKIYKDMYEFGNKFFFVHKYDKRGRVYPIGYQLNPQGNDFAKSCLEFANKESITDSIEFVNATAELFITFDK